MYDKIVAEGGEGVVLKNVNYHYEDSNSRSRFGWVKVKRCVELTAYVSGFEQGKPGSEWEDYVSCLIFSVITKQGHFTVAKVSNLPWQFRKDISLKDSSTNKVKLRMDVYGKVAALSGLEMSKRAFRLVHPKIVQWRDDLKQVQCIYAKEDLTACRLGTATVIPMRIVTT